jgi:glycosyltransferase involved in cell wall biosynthesis
MKLTKLLPSVTIGIPAYNEQENIKNILLDLLSQSQQSYKIDQIVVASDGSTDLTLQKAKTLKSKIIKTTQGPRIGKAKRILKILKSSTSDCTIVLDADTRISDKNFIQKLAQPIFDHQADLTSAAQIECNPRSFVEKTLYTSMVVLNDAYSEYRNGSNFFTCHGQARGFSRQLAKKLYIPFSSGEDLFTYLFCLHYNFKYQFVDNASTHYRLPSTLSDHLRQSTRFVSSTNRLKEIFPCSLISQELKIPTANIVKHAFLQFTKQPIYLITYCLIFVYSRLVAKFNSYTQDNWVISRTSKLGISI